MNGGMRIDPKALPLRHQEQVAAAILAQIKQIAPVVGCKEAPMRNKQPVRRLVFVNDRAARRYRILRKQAESGAICELLLHTDKQGRVGCFTYTITEEF